MQGTTPTKKRPVLRVPDGRRDVREAVADADVSVVPVGPTGVSGLDPLVTATAEGRTAFYPDCSPERAAAVADALADGTITEGDGATVVDHAPDISQLPAPEGTGLDVGTRRVLAGCGWRRPTDADDHRAAGGFADADGESVLETADGLRGRGWGDWCHDEVVAPLWRRVRDNDRGVVVVNAHGTGADALLLRSAPFEVLEGADLAARAAGADEVLVYVSEADEAAAEQVRAAVRAYPDPAAPVDVVTGPDAYRAAEPTMALEACEANHRVEARLRPPGQAAPTLHETPALVHTARTLAHLAVAVRTEEAPSTRLVTVSGDVAAPATVELPAETSLAAALDAVRVEGEFKAAAVGGRFGGLTPSLDVAADPEALASADLGTEGTVEVLADDRCVLRFVGQRTQFAADANCGRCVPCREGTTQLAELLRDIYEGEYDADGIAELIRVMDASSICAFGVDAGRPARTAMAAFDAEFEAHADGRCPTGACPDPREVSQ